MKKTAAIWIMQIKFKHLASNTFTEIFGYENLYSFGFDIYYHFYWEWSFVYCDSIPPAPHLIIYLKPFPQPIASGVFRWK